MRRALFGIGKSEDVEVEGAGIDRSPLLLATLRLLCSGSLPNGVLPTRSVPCLPSQRVWLLYVATRIIHLW